MRDSALRLQDKTILLTGPFNGTTQSLIRTMTEFGCDIAFASDQTPNASKYTDGINEAREVHAEYGRAAHFHLPLRNEKDVMEVLGRMADGFGRTDVLIDASPLSWTKETAADSAIALSRMLAEKVIPFLAAKQKGRIIYVFEDECLGVLNNPTLPENLRTDLQGMIGDLARTQRSNKITVNGLSLGVTEDYVLKHYAKAGSIRKSMDELSKTHTGLKLVESTDVGLGAAYLAGALSGSLTGSTLRLTHGFHL
ncbi:MAG: SDR family oxidoreductase [Bdellovibrionales bacterium]|nr:SDR family oxidoreductase [Bdellovibrionales bacterium]